MRRAWRYCLDHRATIAYLVLVVVLLGGVYRVETLARSTHDALCTLRADIEQRADNADRFLREHPGPFPIPGVARAELIRSIEANRRTVASLDDLDC